MKKLGIVRHLDNIGRICLPNELRKSLNLKQGDPVEIFVEGDSICIKWIDLKQNKKQCACCDNIDKLVEKNGIHICCDCIKDLYKEFCDIPISKSAV